MLALLLLASRGRAAGKAAHVVVVVWDGMRPDFVTEQTTPTLWKMAREGVTFAHHHPAYLSATEVNGTQLATGVYPAESGIIGNHEYRPGIDPLKKTGMELLASVRQGDKVAANHYLGYPTVAEILHEHGLRTAIAGSKGVALLHDRAGRESGALGVNVFGGQVLPEGMTPALEQRLGKFPSLKIKGGAADLWTTKALLGPLWDNGVPAFSLLWLGQPDATQHATGPGSPLSLAAIKNCDDNLARVLAALTEKKLREETDIIVVSDHGFSTIQQSVDVAAVLKQHGFHARREFAAGGARDGEIMVISNGGSSFLYVIGHEQNLIESIVHFLQLQPFSGVVLTQKPVAGAFRLEEARINSPGAPDIVLSLRWKADRSANGTPGVICSDASEYGPGQGAHASLSPFEMHNTCVAAGPDFRQGATDNTPSGNIDIAPTVLWLLGIEPQQKQSGRVLREAFTGTEATLLEATPHRLEATYRQDNSVWRQYLEYSEVNGVLYFDEGNGEGSTSHGAAPASDTKRSAQ